MQVMTCRICYEPENLIRVCACDGTAKWVHAKCIQHWINVSRRSECEICEQPFTHDLLRKPMYIENIFEWCLLGGGLSFSYTLMTWLYILVSGTDVLRITILQLTTIFTAVFSFIFIMAMGTLWNSNKKAMPFIVSYFGVFTIANTALQCSAPQDALVPFYIANACICVLSAITDFVVFTLCPLRCNNTMQETIV